MKKLILTLLGFALVLPIFAQQKITLDLADMKQKNEYISSGTVELELLNTLDETKYKYVVKTTISSTLIQPISLDQVNGAIKTQVQKSTGTCPTDYDALIPLIQGARNSSNTEKDLGNKFKDFKQRINKLSNATCEENANIFLEAEKNKSTQISYITDLKPNQKILVTISRVLKADNSVSRVWEFSMTTESTMEKWLLHYGFTYQPSLFRNDNFQYFAKGGANATYTITRMSGDPHKEWQNVSPNIILTHPFNQGYRDSMFGFSILAGTNFSTYNAGAGLSWIIGYNSLLSFGVMYTQKYKLNGQYTEGDILNEPLTFDQLHSKRGGIEMFFSIGIRFDKNPFKGNTENTPTQP